MHTLPLLRLTFLGLTLVAIVAFGAVSMIIVEAQAHGVCAMGTCGPPPPCPSVIKPCLAPQWPERFINNQFDFVAILSSIAIILLIATFAFRKYLNHKDFHTVDYRGG